MTDPTIALSRRCEDSAREAAARQRDVARFGPFEALIDRGTAMIWLNYAVPVAPIDDAPAALEALARLGEHFLAAGRRPRFEFNAALWPDLPALLERAGLELQARHPLMVCTPADLRPPAAPAVTVALLNAASPAGDLRALLEIQHAGFGEGPADPGDAALEGLRAQLRDGEALLALARLDDAPVAAGGIYPTGPIGELAGVATLPAARRRGAAAALSAALSAAFFARGGDLAWLSAGDAIAQAVYAKVGFRLIDERLNYILPA